MRQFSWIAISLLALAVPPPALAQSAAAGESIHLNNSLCPTIESAAHSNNLPVEFFIRLIWQESHFRSDEIGPQTRSGEHALGIAQFMPATAIERGLFDPFNPVAALPKSGEFLAELRDDFGNLGLAAAAYNAGPQRVRDYIAGLRDLPSETRNYVLAVTGHPVEDWIKADNLSPGTVNASSHAEPNEEMPNCPKIITLLSRQRDPISSDMKLNVPSWCRALEHPNTGVCGPVHERLRVSGVPSTRSATRLINLTSLRR